MKKGSKLLLPKAEVRDGYNFKGWLLNDKLYGEDEEVIVNSNMSFTAVYEEVQQEENGGNNQGGDNTDNNQKDGTEPWVYVLIVAIVAVFIIIIAIILSKKLRKSSKNYRIKIIKK